MPTNRSRPHGSSELRSRNSHFIEPLKPPGSGEDAFHMPVVRHGDGSIASSQEEGVVGDVGIIVRIRIPGPLEVAEPATIGGVVVLASSIQGRAHLAHQLHAGQEARGNRRQGRS